MFSDFVLITFEAMSPKYPRLGIHSSQKRILSALALLCTCCLTLPKVVSFCLNCFAGRDFGHDKRFIVRISLVAAALSMR